MIKMKMRDNIPIMMPNAVTPMVGWHIPICLNHDSHDFRISMIIGNDVAKSRYGQQFTKSCSFSP